MLRRMPKVPTNKQLANMKNRSTERMITHQGWISSAVRETGRRYAEVPMGSKSRKPIPEGWQTYEQVRGQTIEFPERIPRRRVSKASRKKKSLPSSLRWPEEEINSWAELAVKEMREQREQFERFLKRQGVKKHPIKMSEKERSQWFNKWNVELQKQSRGRIRR